MLARHRLDSQMSNYDQATTATRTTPSKVPREEANRASMPNSNVSNNNIFGRFSMKPELQHSANQ